MPEEKDIIRSDEKENRLKELGEIYGFETDQQRSVRILNKIVDDIEKEIEELEKIDDNVEKDNK